MVTDGGTIRQDLPELDELRDLSLNVKYAQSKRAAHATKLDFG